MGNSSRIMAIKPFMPDPTEFIRKETEGLGTLKSFFAVLYCNELLLNSHSTGELEAKVIIQCYEAVTLRSGFSWLYLGKKPSGS